MGVGNVMQEHHRKKRKKEVQKNKQQRLKARDERVLTTKTVSSVQEDIKKLKIRKNLQPTETQKLQRLEKELKILKEAQSKQPKSHWKPQHSSAPKLDDPRKSVYFDSQFNPYGAPPPGKPRLYHRRGGGVTMNLDEAIVPGEEPAPPPPPPPPQHNNHRQANDQRGGHHGREDAGRRSPSHPRKEIKSQSTTIDKEQAKKRDSKEEKKKPLTIPSLPPPSKAVERARRGNLNADIWASNEEVDYELQANKKDLEADNVGEVKKKAAKKKKKKPPLEFYYQDMSGQVQGPFKKAQMREWINAGFFPPSIRVKTSRNDTWLPISEVQALEETPAPSVPANEPSISDRIAALKGETTMQDRIAALKEETTMQDRIAALKEQNQDSSEHDDDENDEVPSEFEDRIAALRNSLAAKVITQENQGTNGDNSTLLEASPAHPPPDGVYEDEQEMGPAYPPPDDVYEEEHVVGPAYSPPDDVYDEEQHVVGPAYPPHDDVYDEKQELEPAYPPPDDVYDGEDAAGPAYPQPNDVPAYPLEEQGVAPYPVDESFGKGQDQGPAPYPVAVAPYPPIDEYPATAPYPVDDAYPSNAAYPASDAYPVSEGDLAYPVTDTYPAPAPYPVVDESEDIQGPQMGPPMESPKKTVKVDKAVVAFRPSHLRKPKRKPAAVEESDSAPKRTKVEAKKDKSGTEDDLDKFMEEIDGL